MAVFDLNADVGEGVANDAALLAVVTSANVACGGHAGDPATMRATLRTAQRYGVVVGAHPGWADRAHFGRARQQLPADGGVATLDAQIAALRAIAAELGTPVRYVKLHGALANQAAEDPALAATVAQVLAASGLGWLVMAQTAMQQAATTARIPHYCEAFADRTYTPQGLLTPREQPGAVLHDAAAIADRALAMLSRQALPLADGRWLPAAVDSLCVHGDTPGALDIARTLRQRLTAAGWQARALAW